jgi:hypothetical protein
MSYMNKLIAAALVLALPLTGFSQSFKSVDATYAGQSTISSYKLNIKVVEVGDDGSEHLIASGLVYTQDKKHKSGGAMYNGDGFISGGDSPNNLVATIKKEGIYTLYTNARDKAVKNHLERKK